MPNTFRSSLAGACATLIIALAGSAAPAAAPDNVGIDQKLDAQLPLDLVFRDEQGAAVTLRQCIGNRPAVLTLVYYRCPGTCSLVLNAVAQSLNGMAHTAGEQFNVITISFDPRETPSLASAKKERYLAEYPRPAARHGWRFLTGGDSSIRPLADAVGFRYAYDPRYDQYAHANGIMVLTPQGRVSRYLLGLDYPSSELADAIQQAGEHRIGRLAHTLILFCFHYDAATGRYTLAVMKIMRLAGALGMAGLATLLGVNLRREYRHRKTTAPPK